LSNNQINHSVLYQKEKENNKIKSNHAMLSNAQITFRQFSLLSIIQLLFVFYSIPILSYEVLVALASNFMSDFKKQTAKFQYQIIIIGVIKLYNIE
jgi:hypothetical protein